jgi:hypothetical protein
MMLAKGFPTGPLGYVDWRAVRQPYARVDYIPQSGLKNLASVRSLFRRPKIVFFQPYERQLNRQERTEIKDDNEEPDEEVQ